MAEPRELYEIAEVAVAALREIENGGRCLEPFGGGYTCGKCPCCIARRALVQIGAKEA